ncbi:ABC transporter substrate-binding protein [Ramlibacter sp.]|uniref:ABC transporter substrate-binding protein n=1 Tax=Ramlibacter sp. TaxID=1917967 RepID=UPI0035AF7457
MKHAHRSPNRRTVLKAASLTPVAATALAAGQAHAQDRKDVLIMANEFGPNMLDIHGLGANRPSYGVAWNCYDRLMTYGRKKLPDGSMMYDYSKLEPELAERWKMDADGMGVTFYLRKDAKFHDGTPVTADDVKWSFDRALGMGGFPTFQMKAGSLEEPSQFKVVDKHTLHVKFIRKDKLSMPDLAVPVASIYNSTLAKKHATDKDPWAAEWLKTNEAGGGAYKVASWKPGQELVLERFDDWKSGPLPKIKRIIQRDVPSAGNRRALLARGDIDMTYSLPPKDFSDFAGDKGKLKVASLPVENALFYLGMLTSKPPFNNVKLRQAVAYALPYDKIFESAFYGRGIKMSGGSNEPKSPVWPIPHGYKQDIAKAKQLMTESGVAPFETTLSYDLGSATVGEPTAILIQEALAQIGIKVTLNKVPGANWRAALLKKDMPMTINRFGGWLNYPEYFFFWCYHGQNAVFNTMSYQNPVMDKLITNARFAESKPLYDGMVKDMIKLAHEEVPRIPLVQPMMDVAMQPNITGYTYWFHLEPDYRQLVKGPVPA